MSDSDFVSVLDVIDNDPRGEKLKPIKEEVLEIDSEIKCHMDTGLSPSDMAVAQKLREGTQAATNILNMFSVR